jgi:transposase
MLVLSGWIKLPTELGHGSGWTCWRRREGADAGVFDQLHHAVLADRRLWPEQLVDVR